MSAYIVADIDITDAQLYEHYKPLASAAIEKYGAKPARARRRGRDGGRGASRRRTRA